MKHSALVCLFSAFIPAFTFALDSGADLEAPGGVWWHKKSRITIKQPLILDRALHLRADEVVIANSIITEGYPLDIETRKLIFEKNGRIDAFTEPAKDVADAPEHPTAAATGKADGGKGEDGAPGRTGFTGRPGMGAVGPLPSEIKLFTADLEGQPIVSGVGERGGRGGKGGTGQTGGEGGKGTNGGASWANGVFGGNHPAGKGGKGGAYGKGGKGGEGGLGGSPVPVSWLFARDWKKGESKTWIVSAPGAGGYRGNPGKPGEPGGPGPGGDGEISSFLFFSSSEPPGPAGEWGEVAPADPSISTLGPGAPGADGALRSADFWLKAIDRETPLLLATFPDFEAERYKVTSSWFEFHWWRLFELVTRSSLSILLPDESQESATPLQNLLAGELEPANLEVVASHWEKVFVQPLQARLSQCTDPSLSDKLRNILAIAEPYTRALSAALKRQLVSVNDTKVFKASVEASTKERARTATASVEACAKYVKDVLLNPRYQKHLATRQSYFEVPVCRQAQEFLNSAGVQQPILLTLGFEPVPGTETIPALEVERAVAPETGSERRAFLNLLHTLGDLLFPDAFAGKQIAIELLPINANLTENQRREFKPQPSRSSVVGGLGIHQGYVFPKRKFTIGELDKLLHALVVMR